jgi:succinyl-diaminopimelate desuccinylase
MRGTLAPTHSRWTLMQDQLFARIDERVDELVDLTRRLIRIPTINPPGDAYVECARLIGNRLAWRGFDVIYERGEGAPGDSDRYPRLNVVARRQGSAPGPCVHFNGHIDVVEVGHGWSVDPFAGAVRDGRIYGRGACDMKGGIAASIIAVEALIDIWPGFAGAIEISGTVDEESGGYGGVAHLARKGYFSRPRVDHVIIPEPLNVDRVCLGHRGVWWAEIETFGRIAHGSMPFLGDSAIRHMGAALERFESELWPRLAGQTTAQPVVPEGARRPCLNINSIHGGLSEDFDGLPAAVVADSCRIVIDRRLRMEETLEDARDEIHALLDTLAAERPGFRYAIRDLWSVEPSLTDREAAVVRAVAAGIESVLGRSAEYVISPGTYDQKHIHRIGELKECIAYGPGILDLAHQPDEYVAVDDLVMSAKVMADSAWALLSGKIT